MLETYEQIKALIGDMEDDIRKAAGGNKAAGTRVRKRMQDLKGLSQQMRTRVLENRESGDASE
jgi:predicted transcriptional regulator